MGENFKAFVEFLADNPDGLLTSLQVTDRVKPVTFEKAKAAILKLSHRRGFSCRKLVRRCHHHEWGDQLLKELAFRFYGKKRWKNFVHAIITTWSPYFSRSGVKEILAGFDMVGYLLKEAPDVLLNAESIAYSLADTSAYWLPHVRHYIANDDFRRAYDELRKAAKGVRVGPNRSIPTLKDNEIPRALAASPYIVGELTRELYCAMHNRNLLPAGNPDKTLCEYFAEKKAEDRRRRREQRAAEYEARRQQQPQS